MCCCSLTWAAEENKIKKADTTPAGKPTVCNWAALGARRTIDERRMKLF